MKNLLEYYAFSLIKSTINNQAVAQVNLINLVRNRINHTRVCVRVCVRVTWNNRLDISSVLLCGFISRSRAPGPQKTNNRETKLGRRLDEACVYNIQLEMYSP